ncbi:MAG: hypothetical protein ABSG53_00570, partial [Thermoguttaceae bacterium]
MASLADERLARLYRWFLDAAEHFPDLHFVAVTPAEQLEREDHWPYMLDRQRKTLGLTTNRRLEVLGKPAGTLFAPINVAWIWIDGKLWEGSFLNGKRLERKADTDDERHAVLKAQHDHLLEAIEELERLAEMAAEYFEVPPLSHHESAFPLENKPSHRWLEIVTGTAFKETDNQSGFLVRKATGDIFTASALTIESLATTATTTPKQGEGTGGADSTLTQPAIASGTARKAVLQQLKPAVLKAYLAFQYAEKLNDRR